MRWLFLVLFAVIAAPGPAAAQRQDPAVDLSGDWKSRFGRLTLVQDGRAVRGRFDWRGGGEFEGRLDGGFLEGEWKTLDGAASGTWKLEVQAGGARLAGVSREDRPGAEPVTWSAVRPELIGRFRTASGEPDGPGEASWSGRWETTLGAMTLQQTGATVRGVYDWSGGGTLAGRADGRTLEGQWVSGDKTGRGEWKIRLSGKGDSFRGTYSEGPARVHGWSGRRTDSGEKNPGARAPRLFDGEGKVFFDGRFRCRLGALELVQAGSEVTGFYEWDGGGSFSGTATGRRLEGEWRSWDGEEAGRWIFAAPPGVQALEGRIVYYGDPRAEQRVTARRAGE